MTAQHNFDGVASLILYRAEIERDGAKVARWYATATDARLSGGAVERVELSQDEIIDATIRGLNTTEARRAGAIKREAKKTQEQATAIANKVWAKRRENGTDKHKK